MTVPPSPAELPPAATPGEGAPAPAPPAPSTETPSQGLLHWIPAKARTALLMGLCVMVAMLAWIAWSAGESTLQLVCTHSFREADLSVRVDGDLLFSEHLSGASRKRLGVFGSVVGNFSRAVSLPSGEHVVEVHLRSPQEG